MTAFDLGALATLATETFVLALFTHFCNVKVDALRKRVDLLDKSNEALHQSVDAQRDVVEALRKGQVSLNKLVAADLAVSKALKERIVAVADAVEARVFQSEDGRLPDRDG